VTGLRTGIRSADYSDYETMNRVVPPFFDVRGRGFHSRADVDAVLHLLDSSTTILPSEFASVSSMTSRVLASAVHSPVNVPGFNRAAMDGFAVRAVDTVGATTENPRVLSLVGEARTARPYSGILEAGQTVSITTGAPVPTGGEAILVLEAAQVVPAGRVLARVEVAAGRHISRVGEDVKLGQEVLPARRLLRPQDLGLLASIGIGTVEVVRKPRVAILVTGNELLPPGSKPSGYEIVDSNSPMLTALVARDGGECLPVQRIRDDEATIREAILKARKESDAILITGGSSVGAEDYCPRVVAELGELVVHGIAIRPAGPTGVAFIPPEHPDSHSIPLFLLPGNPVSCLCAYDIFAGRVVRRLGGRAWELPYRKILLPLAEKITSAVGRVDYMRVKVEGGRVIPLTASGASNLSSTVFAAGFVMVARDCEIIEEGEMVEVWLYE
jgi:molybdopterin molybdotransferase